MYKLSQIIMIFFLTSISTNSQNPHGKNFKIDCAKCHSEDSWIVDFKNISFDHNITAFPLKGMHEFLDCRECHSYLILSEVKNTCIECHIDIHNNTVSPNCNKCHCENDWIINDIKPIHEEAGFPFTGIHQILDCTECHDKSIELIFEPLPTDCFACHENDYNDTKTPDHIEGNFSIECYQCHDLNAETWVVSHDFFPLEKSHELSDCFICHTNGNYTNTSPECYSCHSEDYNTTSNPNHLINSFSKDCKGCHTLDPSWSPANYENHDDNDFPIFSGKHKGEWSQCADCHVDMNNYSIFTCTECHEHNKTKMDDEHDDVAGYLYESTDCFRCHPDGSK